MDRTKFYRSAGTGLICLGLLVYEVLSVRLLSIVIGGPLAIFAIAFAMLGMGAATSFMTVNKWPDVGRDSNVILARVATVLGLAYPLCIFLLTLSSEHVNATLEGAMAVDGLAGLIDAIRDNLVWRMLWVGAVMFIPYFIFGVFIAALFKSAGESEYHQYYAADLIGASLGCILFVIVLDHFGYPGGLFLIFVCTFAGAAAFSMVRGGRALIVPVVLGFAAAIAVLNPHFLSLLEPEPPLNQLARNYERTHQVDQKWRFWNAQSRVAMLEMTDRESGDALSVYAHEDGAGWAYVPPVPDSASPSPGGSLSNLQNSSHGLSRFVTMYGAKRILVLFAGVGSDMVALDRQCGGRCTITGVEINRQMVEHALAGGSPGMRRFLDRPEIRLEVAEAREFLGRDPNRYDAILLSWWGAGTSHYLGTSGMLAQYMYTKQAFESLLQHLTPEGLIVLYNGNKAQALLNFRTIFEEQGRGGLADRVVIMDERPDQLRQFDYFEPVDSLRMILKPSGLSGRDIEIVHELAEDMGRRIILSPARVDQRYQIYDDIIRGRAIGAINRQLFTDHKVELSVVTDDRPFFDHLVPRANYFGVARWFDGDLDTDQWIFVKIFAIFTAILAVVSTIIIIGPLVTQSGPAFSSRNFVNLFYFFCLGAGFILIEVALIRKFGLILGHPSYSIAIVLAALILSTGLGSLATRRLFEVHGLTEARASLLVVVYVLAALAGYHLLVEQLIALPIPVKAAIVVCALLPLGFLMGQLFPQGLARVAEDDSRLVPWAWAINGTASTVGVGVADLLSHPLGFNVVLYIGTAFYAAIFLLSCYALPRRRMHRGMKELSFPGAAS